MRICSIRSLQGYFSSAGFVLFLFVGIVMSGLTGCGAGGSAGGPAEGDEPPSGFSIFQPVIGIDFYEVRRTFDTGISYDSMGFVQAPEWHLKFAAQDSVLIYSPVEDRLLGYRMYHDHDQYFHFARKSWRVVELHPDSITLQQLSLKGLKVDRVRSNVYMKFYSERFIREQLGDRGTSVAEKVAVLRMPTALDSAFVEAQIARANRYPDQPDSAFASKQFAELKSKNPALTIRKKKLENTELTGESPSYEYLYPEYIITIDDAYRDFGHDFSVVVDETGKMHLGKVFVMEEFVEARRKVIQGIIDVYLHNWLDIKPAETMGMPHSSVVYLYVKGRAGE